MKSLPRLAVLLATTLIPSASYAAEAGVDRLGKALPAWSALPFVGILLSIALFPLFAPHFWHRHYPKVAAAWALVLLIPFVLVFNGPALHEVAHMAIIDYIPFIILLASLFTIGGGIYIGGTLRGAPATNLGILVIGTLLASWIGTTGAAMLLIRPLLRANRERRHKVHTVVFFIFLVANVGGCLTPLGDPPLFLGFLHGVPFFWTLTLWKEMLLVAAILLSVYFALDTYFWRKEDVLVRQGTGAREPLRIEGWHNLFFLAGVLAGVIGSGILHLGEVTILGVQQHVQNLLRDALLVTMLALSWLTTSKSTRQANEFTWEPIREVAILFAGIFATIIPPLTMLRAGESGELAFVIRTVHDPGSFFWATGLLSSFLDNAPTYLTFLSTSLGRLWPGLPEKAAILQLIEHNNAYLQAIACGAVFMGANTYIGNAPNFMIKSIAEEAGVKMPSFFGYIVRYTVPFLIPAFVLIDLVFFE
jgi:Na+/H+ antiporter NhaD/arsenite permease-like protein